MVTAPAGGMILVGGHQSLPLGPEEAYWLDYPAGASYVCLQNSGPGAIRFTLDGSAPSAERGFLIKPEGGVVAIPRPEAGDLNLFAVEATEIQWQAGAVGR